MTESLRAMPLQVDIVSDVVCPWCIVGYKQLQKAFDTLPGQFDPVIRWHPFELNPDMPQEGQDLREHITQKYGATAGQGQSARNRLVDLGKSLGFTFDYYEGMRMVNTFRAHQLLHWASEMGRQTELKLALFDAFFSRRENINDPDVLIAVAQRVGLCGEQAAEVLGTGINAQPVRDQQRYWLDREVHAVPTFQFQQQYWVPGAQEAEAFVRVLQRIRARADSPRT